MDFESLDTTYNDNNNVISNNPNVVLGQNVSDTTKFMWYKTTKFKLIS